MGYQVLFEEVVQCYEIKPEFFRDNEQCRAGSDGGGEVTHTGIETETGIGGDVGGHSDVLGLGIGPAIDGNVPMGELHTFGNAGGTAGI